jgi:virginiamycin B lyase
MRTAVIAAARCHFLIRLKGEDAEMSNEKTVISLAVSIFLLIFFASVSAPVPVASANSQNSPAALTGIVSSEAEGPMEGVLVSAKPAGGSISVTVVSDAQGRYSFSADRLMPGRYRLAIRAIGYDAADPYIVATVGKGEREADITLNSTRDLAAQLADVEWLMSIPGTAAEKEHLFLTCSSCHTLAPVLKST